MEHAGDGGVQLFVGTEMKAYGDQAAAASKHVFFSWQSQAGNIPAIINTQWYNWHSQA